MSTPFSLARRFELGGRGRSARGSRGASSGAARGRSSPLGCACDAGKLSGLSCASRSQIAALGDLRVLTCSDVASHYSDLSNDVTKTDAAIESSGVGAKDPAWLSQWQAFVATFLQYGGTVQACGILLPTSPKPATIQDQLNLYADQLRGWQTQAIAKGIVIPGGVRPMPSDPGGVPLTTWLVIAAVGVGFLAFVVHEATKAAGRVVPLAA